MNAQQLTASLRKKIEQMDEAKLVYGVATEVHRQKVKRVFEQGVKAGGKIGTYSTRPAYYSRKAFVRKGGFKQRGKGRAGKFKNGKERGKGRTGKFKNGKERRSMYFPGGHKDFRQANGRESAFVNLRFTNDLHNDFATKLRIKDKAVVSGVSRVLNAKKIEGLEKKYGSDLLKHTKEERQFFFKEVGKKLIGHLRA